MLYRKSVGRGLYAKVMEEVRDDQYSTTRILHFCQTFARSHLAFVKYALLPGQSSVEASHLYTVLLHKAILISLLAM
jgi:hypothetical protein